MLNLLHGILTDNPLGLTEHQVIKQLQHQQHPFFAEADLHDPLSLFRTHFVLFNALYQLRDQLRSTSKLDLHISVLLIRLVSDANSLNIAQTAMQNSDPLRAYYLDLNHLQATDRSAAEALLYGSLHSLNPPAQVQEALAELGIEQPWHDLSDKVLRQHYRHLVSIHHPDRGGCTERVQRINQAMDVLRKHQQRHLSRR